MSLEFEAPSLHRILRGRPVSDRLNETPASLHPAEKDPWTELVLTYTAVQASVDTARRVAGKLAHIAAEWCYGPYSIQALEVWALGLDHAGDEALGIVELVLVRGGVFNCGTIHPNWLGRLYQEATGEHDVDLGVEVVIDVVAGVRQQPLQGLHCLKEKDILTRLPTATYSGNNLHLGA